MKAKNKYISIGEGPTSYVFSRSNLLGIGTNGSVYLGYELNANRTINEKKPVAIKEFKDNYCSFFDQAEKASTNELHALQRFSDFRSVLIPQKKQKKIYLISRFFLGKNISSSDFALSKLTFVDRLNLISQLILQINQLHHNTNYGEPMLHGDLKPDNVMLSNCGKVRNCHLIDFGLALFISDISELIKNPSIERGEPSYFPPETLKNNFGLKTDIFMLVSVILKILGVGNPFEEKVKILHELGYDKGSEKAARTLFSTKGLIDFPNICGNNFFRELTLNFIQHMQAEDYHERPNSDVVLRFFITLTNLYKHNDKKSIDFDYFSAAKAELFLYSKKLWPTTQVDAKKRIDQLTEQEKQEIFNIAKENPEKYAYLQQLKKRKNCSLFAQKNKRRRTEKTASPEIMTLGLN